MGQTTEIEKPQETEVVSTDEIVIEELPDIQDPVAPNMITPAGVDEPTQPAV